MSRSETNASSPGPPDRRAAPRTDPRRRAHHDLIYNFARSCEAHDADADGHLHRIRALVALLALEMGFDPDDAEELSYDAMLHDVGKLHVPPAILNKPDPLLPHERSFIQSHVTQGEAMLRDRPGTARAARIARHHHEAWDGSGYPDGLAGEAIPIEARLTAVADVFDALVANRSYKVGWSIDRALAEVQRLAGTKLDPTIVDALFHCQADGRLRGILVARGTPS